MEVQPGVWQEGERAVPQVRAERLLVEGDLIKYTGKGRGIGVYVSQEAVTTENNYFELTILNTDMFGAVSIGVCHVSYPLKKMPGWDKDSLGYHGDDGMLYRGNAVGYRFGPRCGRGDRMGCGVRPVLPNDKQALMSPSLKQQTHYVFFTRNGKEIGSVTVVMPQGGLYPCVGLAGPQDMVRIAGPFPPPSSGPVIMSPHSPLTTIMGEEAPMAVDHNEDDWSRLHDVKLSGQCVSYRGRGQQIEDIGLAVAKHALSPASHYFQLQILDPGKHTYITIGITKKKYPRRCHPGWRAGSVAYHADDGKVFTGSSAMKGTDFGPPCGKGDVMGCGILFPRDYCHNNYLNSYDDSSGDESDDGLQEGDRVPYCSDGDDDDDNNDYEDYLTSQDDLMIPHHGIIPSEAHPALPDQHQPQQQDEGEEDEDEEIEDDEADELDDDEGGDDNTEEQDLELMEQGRGSRTSANSNRGKSKNNSSSSAAAGGDSASAAGAAHKAAVGFINRNSLLIKDLKPPRRPVGKKGGEPVVQVFFTRNGCLLGRVEAVVPKGGFFPTISLGGRKETVRVDLRPLSG
uniref:SPRY domain-containing protein 3-like n=1 Tax=Hirondellea gigas TaxID=1518452 RepID=A0A2P2I4T9_9CRUS